MPGFITDGDDLTIRIDEYGMSNEGIFDRHTIEIFLYVQSRIWEKIE